tara:strand:- start:6338 stop:6574 length:237 start_codon:yes stop_codon:yes gene_type:complete
MIELPKTITIDEAPIDVESLSADGKTMVARVVELRSRLTQLNIEKIELESLIGSWAKSIKDTITVVEDEPIEVTTPDD